MSLVNIKQIRNLPQAASGATIIFNGSTNVWSNNDTGGLQLSVGTSAQRLDSLTGVIRFNSTTEVLEFNDGGDWSTVIVDASSAGTGEDIFARREADILVFRTIQGAGAVDVRTTGDNIFVSAAPNPTNISELNNDVGYTVPADFEGSGIIQVRTSGSQVIVSAANPDTDDEFRVPVTQSAHGFVQGQAIYLDDSDGLWKLAQADEIETLGVALVDDVSTNSFTAVFGGRITHSGLIPGDYYFVSPSAPGALVNTEPTVSGFYSNPILYATGLTEGVILPLRPNFIGEEVDYITETSADQKYVQQGSLSSLSQFNNDQGFVSANQFTGGGVIDVNVSGSEIRISAASVSVNVEATNLGGGQSVAVSTSGSETSYRTITVGGGIELSASPNELSFSAAPNPVNLSELNNDVGYITEASANTAFVNEGDLSALSQFNNDTNFTTLTTAQSTTIANNALTNLSALSQFNNDVGYITAITSESLGTGEDLVSSVSGQQIKLRTISGAGIIEVRTAGDDIIVSAATTEAPVQATNLGGGQEVAIGTSSQETQYRTLAGAGIIDVRTDGNQIVFSAAPTPVTVQATTQGGGISPIISTSGQETNYRSFVGTGTVEVRQSANTINVSGAGFRNATTASGTSLIFSTSNSNLQLRGLTGQGTLQVRTTTSAIVVSAPRAVVTTSSRGTGSSILANTPVSAITGNRNELIFKSVEGAGAVQVSAGTNSIVFSAAPNPVNLSDLNNDEGFISGITETTLGGGSQVIVSISGGNDIQQRSISGGGIVNVSGGTSEITVSAANEMSFFVTQSSHGFSQGQPVYLDSSDGLWKLAQADDANTLGVALVNDPTTNTFTAVFGGRISTLPTEYQPGEYYFISASAAGTLTATKPTGETEYVNPIIHAITSSISMVLPWRPNSVAVSGAGGGTGSDPDAIKQGKHTLWQPSGSMLGKITGGPEYRTSEVGTAQVLTPVYCFDASVQESVQFTIAMPKSWDESTISYQVYWTQQSAGTGNAVWEMRAMALGDGDAIDGTWGSVTQVVDAGGSTDALFIASESSAVTIGNTPQEGDLVIFEIRRDAADASDTLGADACLIGAKIFYTVNAPDDS